MNKIEFEWNDEKSKINIKKHGVTFEEAISVFYDDKHSEREDRFLMLGLSENLNLLLVCHCYREPEGKIRIISARKATKNESKNYGR